jgi:hypothetical protein
MTAIEKRFLDAARAELLAEDQAKFASRVRERAIRLQGEAQRIATGAAMPSLAAMQAELAALDARPAWSLSAADDQRRDWLRSTIFDLTRPGRRTAA